MLTKNCIEYFTIDNNMVATNKSVKKPFSKYSYRLSIVKKKINNTYMLTYINFISGAKSRDNFITKHCMNFEPDKIKFSTK